MCNVPDNNDDNCDNNGNTEVVHQNNVYFIADDQNLRIVQELIKSIFVISQLDFRFTSKGIIIHLTCNAELKKHVFPRFLFPCITKCIFVNKCSSIS